MRRTKIVCTIGPASNTRGNIERLLRAGMNVARLNFSHGTHEEHARVIVLLREQSARLGQPLAILQDLSGPKVRLGSFDAPYPVFKSGQYVGLTAETIGLGSRCFGEQTCSVLPLPILPLLEALKPKDILLVDDGKIQLRVVQARSDVEPVVWTKCLVGGEISPRKGVTAPGVSFDVAAVTEKDLEDLRFGLAQGVDWVAASYVRRASDLTPLKEVMQALGVSVPLIAKIEKFEAVKNLESILGVVDGMMVARGDLGVETPFDEVPIVQKRIIKACNRAGKPVITATQMLESMLQNPRPTRAEAADVANAILDGTDAVMLSGETAAGLYPVEAVQTMHQIAVRTEAAFFQENNYAQRIPTPTATTEAVACATAEVACQINASAILCATTSGQTARKVAQHRPRVPILAATTRQSTVNQLALSWGVLPFLVEQVMNTDTLLQITLSAAQQQKWIRIGDLVVLTAGVPVNNPGSTNLLKVHTVGQPLEPRPSEPNTA